MVMDQQTLQAWKDDEMKPLWAAVKTCGRFEREVAYIARYQAQQSQPQSGRELRRQEQRQQAKHKKRAKS
jgi:hypothetical protein